MTNILNDARPETLAALHDRPAPDRHPKASGARPTDESPTAYPAIVTSIAGMPEMGMQSFRSLSASLPLHVAEALYEAATQTSREGFKTEVDEAQRHALDLLAADPESTLSDICRVSRRNVESFVLALKPYGIATPGGRIPCHGSGTGDRT